MAVGVALAGDGVVEVIVAVVAVLLLMGGSFDAPRDCRNFRQTILRKVCVKNESLA